MITPSPRDAAPSARSAAPAAARIDGRAVLLVSGLIGWGGGLVLADWHWAVEHAQWTAGLVVPVDGSLGAALHGRLWSVVPQVGALALRMGVTEWWLALVLSGLAGLLTCQALGMFVFAFSRHALASILALALLPILNDVASGAAYPVMLMGSPHSYGVFGMAVPVLALALLGSGWSRSGAALLAVAPAVHLPLGVFAWGIVVLARPERVHWNVFSVGVTITALSAAVHVALAPPGLVADANATSLALTFAKFWDGHRLAVDPAGGAFMLTAATVIIVLLARPRSFIERATLIAAVAGLIGAACTWIPVERVPAVVLSAMPGRLMNVTLLTWPAVVAGLLVRWLPAIRVPSPRWFLPAAAVSALAVTSGSVAFTRLEPAHSTPVLAAIAAQDGPLVTAGSVWHIQARTRRPVLLDGGTLDALAYVPEAAVFARDVLHAIYGLDLERPPHSALGGGVIPAEAHRRTWEARPLDEWIALRDRFGITGVLTDGDWTLALPLIAGDDEQRLYLIPETSIAR